MQIITTHKNTDFDALASTICATLLYPGAVPVVPRILNPNVKEFLSIHKTIFDVQTPDTINPDTVTRLIVVDTGSWNRLDMLDCLKHRLDVEIFIWDHHPPGDIQPDWVCRDETGATISLMVEKLMEQGTPISPIQATLFLGGLYEDTGNMTFPSTKPRDAHVLAHLLESGADLNLLNAFIRTAYGKKQKDILFEMLKSAQRVKICGYSVSINKLKISGHVDNLGAVMNMYREIVGVDAAFGIFINGNGNKCMVIGRSNNIEGLDIGGIMRNLGGGGHPAAGSALVKTATADEVEATIVRFIEGNAQSAVQISDIMSYPVHSVSPETSMKQAAIVLREKGCTGLPVIKDGKLVGIISRRDFSKLRRQSSMNAPVKAFMRTNVITIHPGVNPIEASRLMVKHDIGRLPVVENDKVIGIVTRSDTMAYFYDMMPE